MPMRFFSFTVKIIFLNLICGIGCKQTLWAACLNFPKISERTGTCCIGWILAPTWFHFSQFRKTALEDQGSVVLDSCSAAFLQPYLRLCKGMLLNVNKKITNNLHQNCSRHKQKLLNWDIFPMYTQTSMVIHLCHFSTSWLATFWTVWGWLT